MSCVRIGVDLDNTIVSYDRLIQREVSLAGLSPPVHATSKRALRDFLRSLPEGEDQWQRIQAEIYGPKMAGADLICGAKSFFKACASRGIPTAIISHKTVRAKHDTTNTDLRETAVRWLEENLFGLDTGIGVDRVFFGSTRREKIDLIRGQECSHFIDDLVEVFLEGSFPSQVERILFDPSCDSKRVSGILVSHSWKQIQSYIIDDN